MAQAFPESDPVARFTVGLGLIANEWHRTMRLMPKTESSEATDDERGIRLMLARQQAATCHEAIKFIADSRRNYPNKVGTFIDGLNTNALEHYSHLKEAADPKSPFFIAWLRDHRNVTLHLPEIHPGRYGGGKDMLAISLREASRLSGYVSHEDTVGSVRFGFADVVSVHMLPWNDPNVMKHLSRARMALGGFAHEAVDTYLKALPPGVVQQTH